MFIDSPGCYNKPNELPSIDLPRLPYLWIRRNQQVRYNDLTFFGCLNIDLHGYPQLPMRRNSVNTPLHRNTYTPHFL
jgi:hypothetical protein